MYKWEKVDIFMVSYYIYLMAHPECELWDVFINLEFDRWIIIALPLIAVWVVLLDRNVLRFYGSKLWFGEFVTEMFVNFII